MGKALSGFLVLSRADKMDRGKIILESPGTMYVYGSALPVGEPSCRGMGVHAYYEDGGGLSWNEGNCPAGGGLKAERLLKGEAGSSVTFYSQMSSPSRVLLARWRVRESPGEPGAYW